VTVLKLSDYRTFLTKRVQLSTATGTVQDYQDQAVGEMIDSCFWRIQDVTWIDLTVNGTTQRWFIPGEDLTILPARLQFAPVGLTDHLLFTDVTWNQLAGDDLIVEQLTKADGTLVDPSADTVGGTISATTAPSVSGTKTKVRVWYQRRIPQPDFTNASSVIRAPEQFGRIATLGYYLGILADNQPGGDVREWRAKSDEYLQQAAQLYQQAVPPVLPRWMRSDDWLVGP
jgi:hypothetical protein